MRLIIDDKAGEVIETLRRRGYRALVVGGSVRDCMMNKAPSDIDIVTNAPVEEIFRLFEGESVRQVGRQFSVFLVNGIEVACARSGGESERFPLNDLGMRDFTINSMAIDPAFDGLIDPFSGLHDLENRVVRFTGNPEERILEDPLRIVRACRFTSLLDGSIDPASFDAMCRYVYLLKEQTSPERFRTEILKAMLHPRPSVFFDTLRLAGGLQFVLPSLDRCYDLDGGPYHGETVFEHCMLAGDAVSRKYPLLRLAGFLHDAGKFDAAVPGKKGVSFPGHEIETGAIGSDLKRMAFSTREIEYILAVIHTHMRPLTPDTGEKAVRKTLASLESRNVPFRDFMRIRIADKRSNLLKQPYTLHDIRIRFEKLVKAHQGADEGFGLKHLAITGDDVMKILNIQEGPRVGEALEFLLERVFDDPAVNTGTELERLLIRHFKRGRPL